MGEHALDNFKCEREGCGHPPSWHRLDDSKNIAPGDPAAEFRCLGHDCEAPGPWSSCDVACPDFVAPPGYAEAIAALAEDGT